MKTKSNSDVLKLNQEYGIFAKIIQLYKAKFGRLLLATYHEGTVFLAFLRLWDPVVQPTGLYVHGHICFI